MNILAIADRPPRISLQENLSRQKVDIVCTLGDLDLYEIRELESVKIPKLGVYGNHCSGNYFDELGIINLHLKVYSFAGMLWGGFEGCVRYKDDPLAKMYTQEEANVLLSALPYVDVFISHAPPLGINDGTDLPHQGFRAILNYLDQKKPRYFLHGHTYPTQETLVTQYKDTKIIYVTADQIISLASSVQNS